MGENNPPTWAGRASTVRSSSSSSSSSSTATEGVSGRSKMGLVGMPPPELPLMSSSPDTTGDEERAVCQDSFMVSVEAERLSLLSRLSSAGCGAWSAAGGFFIGENMSLSCSNGVVPIVPAAAAGSGSVAASSVDDDDDDAASLAERNLPTQGSSSSSGIFARRSSFLLPSPFRVTHVARFASSAPSSSSGVNFSSHESCPSSGHTASIPPPLPSPSPCSSVA
mmetsp:Transcript_59563/g.126613  ORF Transcript_59563/g.126613 Transcript_59563/m.126613 type:complete len:223 (-) Transcript_59563:1367-2035(-)